MSSFLEIVSNSIQNSNSAALFLDALLKSFVVLAVAGALCFFLRRASAATRHLIWFLAVASLPCLPLLSSMLPSWQRPLWSVSTGFNSGNQFSLALELAPVRQSGTSARETKALPMVTGASITSQIQSGGGQLVVARFSTSWLVFVFASWLAGIVLSLIFAAVGQLRLGKISRNAQPFQNADWSLLLDETRETLHLRREVILLQSADDLMPLTWGWRRPVVLLPAEAGQWPTERRRVVLLHELAHVKRWDCLTQTLTRITCAFYWFNPLVWLAARRMCVERERACDDLVLNGGCKASDYAGHLLEIARTFRRVPQVAAIAMARPSQLEGRIAAIVDSSRRRTLPRSIACGLCVAVIGLVAAIAAQTPEATRSDKDKSGVLYQQQIARLEAFSALKEKQSQTLAASAGENISPEFQRYFDAATKGDGQTVTNMYESFKRRHPQYSNEHQHPDLSLATSYWGPVLEISLAYDHVVRCEPKYTQMAVDDIINSIPAGSIYFGGTDPGRGLPTAFCKSHADADPFFTLTQNALADGTYLKYLRAMYGGKIYTPTDEDSQNCFNEYVADAQRRLKENKLKPGEQVKVVDGKVQVSGQVAVMSINALLVKLIFDKNPDHEYYIEESFPLDWMYPYLEPHGLIMKINRQPLPELSDEIVRRDRDYWNKRVAGMIGDWLTEETPVQTIAEFVDKVHVRKDLGGFNGDPRFVRNDYAVKIFSKLRSSIAGVYAWRVEHATNGPAKARIVHEADFAFRQAWAICPYSPEATFRYVNLLLSQSRTSDALLVAETTARLPSLQGKDGDPVRDMVKRLKQSQKTK